MTSCYNRKISKNNIIWWKADESPHSLSKHVVEHMLSPQTAIHKLPLLSETTENKLCYVDPNGAHPVFECLLFILLRIPCVLQGNVY